MDCAGVKSAKQEKRTEPNLSRHNISTHFADYFQREVCEMEPEVYWELFCATGDPVAYLLYRGTEDLSEGRVVE